LLQGLARGVKMDWIVQKATELGVLRIQPLMTEHSVVRTDDRQRARKQEHWRAIAASACEQCGRSRLPSIDAATTLDLATQESGSESGRSLWMLDPAADEDFAAAAMTLPARQTPAAIALVIGPEGGLSPTEQQLLQVRGARRLRLGSRILRTETAAIAAIAVLQAIAGDLAGK
jgi:16S rRNA (uracil1498-N3)-methyltransferase